MRYQQSMLLFQERKVALQVAGTGPTLLCLGGGPGLAIEYMAPWLLPLSSSFRLVVYDQTGCGLSEPLPSNEPYTLEREHKLIQHLVHWNRKQNPGQPVYLLGHSFGGLHVMGFLTRFPNEAEQAVLVTSMPILLQAGESAILPMLLRVQGNARRRYTQLIRIQRQRPLSREEHTEFVRLGLSGGLCEPSRIEELAIEYNPRIREDFLQAAQSYDLREEAKQTTTPILVLAGRHDFFALSQQQQIAESFPNATLQILENCAHFPFFETPSPFQQAITDFLLT